MIQQLGELRIEQNEASISVFPKKGSEPILVQNAKEDFRPYLHPIKSPDGKSILTEYSPGHHKHQTGLYWGFTRVNGRDYFHHPESEYWQRVSAEVMTSEGEEVEWQTIYHLLDEKGEAVMEETQNWSMRAKDDKYLLELEWKGKALKAITIGEYDYGGLFLRMPWEEGMPAEVINAARQRDEKAEGQRAMWLDVGMQVEGREDFAHIAIFDHPENEGFPQTWRVDGQFGVGPARARMGDWTIEEGETEVIHHQIVVYTGDLNDVELTNLWEEYQGGQSMYSTASLWKIAQKEGREAKFLTPDEAVKSMTVQDGFKANVWASEPMMSQPMAFCWDDKGRLWVAENLDYESRGSGFSNSGDSRILILEDTDQDGKADTRKVFLEGIAFPAALAVGFDGLFLGAPPNLLFVPDRDGDDKADMEDIEVRLTGWGIRDRHETLNSLHWGPDGWLYGLQGFATPSKVRKPVGKGKLYKHNDPFPEDLLEGIGTDINGGVWRYHPTKDRFEVVAHGFSNPWGIDYDAKGQLFISACVIPHMWHVIPGGIYHRQGGQHFNPFVYNDIKTIADHRHRSAHGGARIYQSDAFPDEHQGRIFMANIHEHAVLSDVLERKGSGFTAHHGDDFLMANNAQWVGFSMEVGPEGALYVLDWHDADICGQEVLNSKTGRIFKISPENSQAEQWKGRYDDLTKMTDAELVKLQTSKSNWHARRARVILQNRASKDALDEQTHGQLRQLFLQNANPDHRLRSMWGLHVTGGFTGEQLIEALNDNDEYIRGWAIQLLCEDKSPSLKALDKFKQMAIKDPSPVVRLYLASALQRIKFEGRWEIAEALTLHAEDAEDHNLPKMIWYGIEPLVELNPELALDMASKSNIPMLSQFIARRAVDADVIEPLIVKIGEAPESRLDLLAGMRDGLEGRVDLSAPVNWKSVYAELQASPKQEVKQLALEIAQQFGDTEAAQQYLATLKNSNAPIEQKRSALNNLARQQREELIIELPSLLNDENLRADAIRAIAEYDHVPLGKLLLKQYDDYSKVQQLEVVQALASRPAYGWMLTQAIKENNIPKSDIPAYVVRQLRRVVGSGFVEVWGPIDALNANLSESYDKYQALLSNQALTNANLANGRVLFQRTCAPCHKMYDEGGNLGPDITGSNRTNLDYLLSNVLNPSGEIQDDYKMVVVTTRDGRTYTGNIAAENERQLTLRVVGQEAVQINKSEIQSRETTPNSMMPSGLFETLTDKEVIDLIAYLQSSEQVNIP
ncbi:putative membrane-bound dehydrogenase-like protein [Catalinimonas alkaloidigena]|uniref:PVC-type heme-binding CxxCH protein n=1 Tax=Catalinimonas alkaloidigena TaxID=1075417 RepID=UPI0024067A06|nr:PVC-type heme-binding CxxCH protein [Catalinimonas alkaloidigena]MDF9797377.1 putative membrane-bound dehydrogenase-like protein [Catalinimonas alkaloidigena]